MEPLLASSQTGKSNHVVLEDNLPCSLRLEGAPRGLILVFSVGLEDSCGRRSSSFFMTKLPQAFDPLFESQFGGHSVIGQAATGEKFGFGNEFVGGLRATIIESREIDDVQRTFPADGCEATVEAKGQGSTAIPDEVGCREETHGWPESRRVAPVPNVQPTGGIDDEHLVVARSEGRSDVFLAGK